MRAAILGAVRWEIEVSIAGHVNATRIRVPIGLRSDRIAL